MKLTVVVGLIMLVRLNSTAAAAGGAGPDFNHDIKPLFSENCYACHGPDPNKRKAELRLDRVEVATGILPSGNIAIIPGKPDQSELIRRLVTEDLDDRMPPAETGKRLTLQQIDLLRRWVAGGAQWDEHWAYRPIRRVEPPEVPAHEFVRNEIDRFILARLMKENQEPSPMADPLTLIRRVSFDLTGLPPSLERTQAFMAAPDTWEQVVDDLLASPEYGERMAAHWLDLVRYADTCGYHGDQHVDVSLYRDYVIGSFNNNLPFNQFTVEQLAGDLIPEATVTQRVASGYNRLLMTTEEGGAQPKEYMAKYAADRVRNASVVWLGATMGCAECHDHKYDPITTRDFYSFAAFFADIREKAVGKQDSTPVPSPEEQLRLEELNREIEPLKEELDIQTPELDLAQAAWEQTQFQWTILQANQVSSSNGTFFEIQNDETILASGKNPDKETYKIQAGTELSGITAFRLEVIPDESQPNDGPGRYDSGNFVLSEFEVYADAAKVSLSAALATFAQDKYPVAQSIDGKADTGWAVDKQAGKPNYAVFRCESALEAATELSIVLRHEHGNGHNLGRFRLAATTVAWPDEDDGPQPPPVKIAEILEVPAGDRTEEQSKTLSAHYRVFAPALDPVRKARDRVQAEIDAVNKNVTRTFMTTTGEPRVMRVLPRGNWLSDDGEVVEPAVPGFLPSLAAGERRNTRLDLANWMVATNNPLVARVFVNRLWKLMFGRGISKSLEDFGAQGTPPTHPALLDWLADEFRSSGWDIKHMMKLIALSGTYRQSSRADPALRERDPYNDLVARQGRFRLEAEMVRDNALEVSALLARKTGGPSAKPYQPAGYWAHLNFPTREYQKDSGDDLYRRSVYTYWCRTFLHPSLAAFDAPTREECTAERVRSNTPQQALVLLNDPIYVEAARVLAELVIRSHADSVPDKIDYAVRRVLGRRPKESERALLAELHQKHLAEYREDPVAAKALLKEGDWPLLKDIDRSELAAWASVTRVLLNLNETIVRR